jgi:uncharacterized protein YajQ (UPF0234 family)
MPLIKPAEKLARALILKAVKPVLKMKKPFLYADNEFQLQQMQEILKNKLVKRGIAVGTLKIDDPLTNLNESRQVVTIVQGIDADLGRKLIKIIKDSKQKVQTAIQGEQVRVTGKKRDDLQDTIACLREAKISLPLQYINFRD